MKKAKKTNRKAAKMDSKSKNPKKNAKPKVGMKKKTMGGY